MHKWFVAVVFASLVAGAFILLRPWQALLSTAVLGGLLSFRLSQNVFALQRLRAARARFDPVAMHKELEPLLRRYAIDPATREVLLFEQGIALLMQERFGEAATLFESLDDTLLSERNAIARRANIIFAKAEAGEGKAVLADAERLLHDARARNDASLPFILGAAATAHLRAGDAGRAVLLFEEALATPVPQRPLTGLHRARLAEAYAATGRRQEALDCLRAAEDETRGTAFAAAVQRVRMSVFASK